MIISDQNFNEKWSASLSEKWNISRNFEKWLSAKKEGCFGFRDQFAYKSAFREKSEKNSLTLQTPLPDVSHRLLLGPIIARCKTFKIQAFMREYFIETK